MRIKENTYKLPLKRVAAIVSLMLISVLSYSQQNALFTQYLENIMLINPAYAGSKDGVSLMAVSRNQWVSLTGAPVTRSISLNSPVSVYNMGLGFSLTRDEIGPTTQTTFFADYSYKLFLAENKTLLLGIKGGVNFYEAGLTNLVLNDPNDPVFASDFNRNFLPNVGVGAFYHTNNYYLGLSVPKIIENIINKNSISTQNINRERIHLFFMAGYVHDINRIIKFKPAILTRFVKNAPVSFDLNTTFMFYDRLWLGAMYRLGDSLGGIFQLQVTDQIKLGYSFDLPISALGAYNKGTHEIMLTYDFALAKGKVRSPRYF